MEEKGEGEVSLIPALKKEDCLKMETMGER